MLDTFREADRRDLADDPGALALLRTAADGGLPAAQTRLGMAYQWGRGVERDYEEAAHWYRLAANQGDPKAGLLHDMLLASGLAAPDGLWSFYVEAVRARTLNVPAWPDALLGMGLIDLQACREGVAVLAANGKISPAAYVDTYVEMGAIAGTEAARQLRELAAKGDGAAACKLGELYATHGLELALGDPDATRWLVAAGEQDEASADLTPVWALLGRLYEAGQGVPRDPIAAYVYHGLAQAHGDDSAAVDLAAMRPQLSGADLAAAQERLEARLVALSGEGRLARLAARVQAGDADAAVQAGIFQELGIVGDPDPAAAAGWYLQAVELGSPGALNHLANLRTAYAFDYESPPGSGS
ncbi:MAG: Sel1-like repeat [Cyanobacteria bacterium RYN_339]|nr:Sel1-like repeat [Cyanobacteria bacterium RYN_339]